MTRPFAYNPSRTPITGCTQIGDIAIGVDALDYSTQPGGLQWWNGPDEDLGYVVAKAIPELNQPNPLGLSAGIGFNRSESKTDESFLNMVNTIWGGGFITASNAKDWLNQNGYWVSYEQGGGVSSGDYNLIAQYYPATNNGAITFPNHNASTFSNNPNLVGQAGYAIYINKNDLLGNSQNTILDNLLNRSGTLRLSQGSNYVVYGFSSSAFETGNYGGNVYYWDNQFEGSPTGSLTVLTPASSNFNYVDPITITIT